MTKNWNLVLAASTAAIAIAAPAAGAQTGGGGSAAQAGGLSEIIVTAQRREENAQSVPLAVSAFSPLQVEAAQLKTTADLVRFTPSVTGGLNTGTGSALSFYIRGLGSTEQIATFDVPVATYVDEIYVARQNANSVSLFDIERVEVLRGPQGTLFGRNTTGGAVSIVTRKPASEFGYFVEGSVGSFQRTQLRGSVDAPVTDKILTKLSGFVVDDEGYSQSLVTGAKLNADKAQGLRAAVRFLPTEKLTWDVAVDYVDQQKTTLGSSPVDPEYKSRSGLRPTDCSNNIREIYLNTSLGNCANVETGGLTSNLAYDLGWSTISFITGYRTTDQNFALDFLNGTGARGGFVIANEVRNQQFTQEVKLVGGTDRVKWVAGLFYLDEDNKTAEIDFSGILLADWKMYNTTESVAAYAQADISLTDSLIATAGVRYTDEKKTLAYTNGSLALTPTRPTSANVRAFGVPLNQSEKRATPRVALTYKLSNDKLVYASATNGFKSGGWNTRVTNAANVTIFGPEKAWTYELGAKTEWFSRKLRVNATAYLEKVDALQLLSGTGGGTTTFVTRNAADLEAKGIELEIAAAPTDALQIFASASASDSEYQNVPARNGGANGLIPCSNTPEPINCTTTRDNPVRFPELQGTLGASYTLPLEKLGGSLSFNGSASYSQTYWTSTYNDGALVTAIPFGQTTAITRPLAKVPPTTLVNVGAVYRSEANHWEAALECSNCTEEYYATSSLFGIGYYNDPRRVTFRIKYTY